MLNICILIGRLTKDPELRFLPSGKAVCGFRLAVDRGFGGEDKQTDFIDVVVWEKQAETCAQHLAKGRQVAVEGRLQIRQYTAQDGSKRQATEVVASQVRFLGGRNESSNLTAAPQRANGDSPPDDDDVPF